MNYSQRKQEIQRLLDEIQRESEMNWKREEERRKEQERERTEDLANERIRQHARKARTKIEESRRSEESRGREEETVLERVRREIAERDKEIARQYYKNCRLQNPRNGQGSSGSSKK
uniref:Uncharacterized protein n=1 Tax=Rhabditophanes sp. KR3021 TaxID=114890 RepID=A0AC35U8C2_9BILA